MGRSLQSWLRRRKDFHQCSISEATLTTDILTVGVTQRIYGSPHTPCSALQHPHGLPCMTVPKVPAAGLQVHTHAHLQSSEAVTTFEKRSSLLRKVCPLLVCVHLRQEENQASPCGDLRVIPKAWKTQLLGGWTSIQHSGLGKKGQVGVRAEARPLQDPITTMIPETPLRSAATSLGLLGGNSLSATSYEHVNLDLCPPPNPTHP